MSIEEIILYLRQQLLEMRNEQDRQAIFELLNTFKMLTKVSHENGDKRLTALLVNLTDAARDLHMGKPNITIPNEDDIRTIARESLNGKPPAMKASSPQPSPAKTDTTEAQPITDLNPPALDELVTSFNQEQQIQQRIRAVIGRIWRDYTSIRDGSTRQMRAYSVVFDKLMVFRQLDDHDPIWVGDYPVDIDTDSSPIQILCNPSSLRPFLMEVRSCYGEYPEFRLTWKAVHRVPTVVARFQVDEFTVELFAQPRPTNNQQQFVNMLVIARLLAIGGDTAKAAIREKMTAETSTSEVVLAHFGLEATDMDAYMTMLAKMDNDTLRATIQPSN
jgi:hypothetical protein